MTDLEKYKVLLDSVGVPYKEEYSDDTTSTLITIQSECSESSSLYYCYWSFISETGKFEFINMNKEN